jgi:hypothetical protein
MIKATVMSLSPELSPVTPIGPSRRNPTICTEEKIPATHSSIAKEKRNQTNKKRIEKKREKEGINHCHSPTPC